MHSTPGNTQRLRSALFIDFDNIFLSLQDEDPSAATRFAREPGKWIRWVDSKRGNCFR